MVLPPICFFNSNSFFQLYSCLLHYGLLKKFVTFSFFKSSQIHIDKVARNEKLEAQLRTALAGVPNVAELQMFRGMAFMVNDKLCMSAGDNELLFRLDPSLHNELSNQ